MVKSEQWISLHGSDVHPSKISDPIKHMLSHQEIRAKFYQIRELHQYDFTGYEKVRKTELDHYPLPKLIGNYLEKFID